MDEKNRVYLEYVDYGNKAYRGGLKHMKVEPKVIRQYENTSDPDHCVVNIFVLHVYLLYLPQEVFYCRPLPDDGSGIPRYGKQRVGRNKLALTIPDMCKEAGIEGYKTGHSGKVTCATTLYHQHFSDQEIKERTGHRSLEALHKYKRTGSDQQHNVSMALLPNVSKKQRSERKENNPSQSISSATPQPLKPVSDRMKIKLDKDNDDDFMPLKKKPTPNSEDLRSLFNSSTLKNCTIDIQYK